jgi:hypothetical protein
MSCPTTSLCVATDNDGNIVTSTNPAGGAGAWKVTNVDGPLVIAGVSCVSVSLCVAIDQNGHALASTDPTGGVTAWSRTLVYTTAGLHGVTSISCVSGPLCVVTDEAGNVVTSTDPTGGASAWTITDIDKGNSISDVSCASSSLCVAVDNAGNAFSSTSPSAGMTAWVTADVNGTSPILGVSCTAAPLCVAGSTSTATQNVAVALTSTNPAGGASAWTATQPPLDDSNPLNIGNSISCVAESLCVAVDDNGNGGLSQSGEPTAGAAGWSGADPDKNSIMTFLRSVSCATRSLCVIGDESGNIVTSIETHDLSIALQGTGTGGVRATAIRCPFTTCSHPVPPGVSFAPEISALACGNWMGQPSGGGTCAMGYPAENEVTLTANSTAGSVFAGWGGACQGSVTSCSLSMTTDEPVLASFALAPPPVPAISDLSETAWVWREDNTRAGITTRTDGKRSLPSGTTFSFDLNMPAQVTLAFLKRSSGRQLGKSCVAQTKTNEKRKRCTRTVIAGTLAFAKHAGPDKVHFRGLISKHKKLKPGSYTVIFSATAANERSNPGTLQFTIATG